MRSPAIHPVPSKASNSVTPPLSPIEDPTADNGRVELLLTPHSQLDCRSVRVAAVCSDQAMLHGLQQKHERQPSRAWWKLS